MGKISWVHILVLVLIVLAIIWAWKRFRKG